MSAKVNPREDPTCGQARVFSARGAIFLLSFLNETYLASRNCEGGDTNAPQKIIERAQPGLD
jgi:hypothetical protein